MEFSFFSILLPLLLLCLVIGALPMIITLIYKHFYTNHLNRVLEAETAGIADATETTAVAGTADTADTADIDTASDITDTAGGAEEASSPANKTLPSKPATGKGGRTWMSPLSVFLIALFAEILLYVACGMVFNLQTTDIDEGYPDADLALACEVITQEEIDDTILAAFDGSEVSGYSLSEDYTEGDITYRIYQNEDQSGDSQFPEYVILLTYTCTEDITYWDSGLIADDAEAWFTGDFPSADGEASLKKVLYAVIGDEISDYSNVHFILNLYTGDREETSDGFGTYDTPEPAAEISIDLP